MKTLKIKDSGSLWRLATHYGELDERSVKAHGTDICEFTRACVKGFFILLVISATLGGFSYLFLDMLLWIAVGLMYSFVSPGLGAAVAVAVVAVATAACLFFYLKLQVETFLERRAIQNQDREPSLASEMFLSWKEKTCFKLEVEKGK